MGARKQTYSKQIYRTVQLSLLILFHASICSAQGTVDRGTQRNGMHSCPVGQFVLGVQAAENLLICAPLPGNFAAEIVDSGTQEQGMHACPTGMAMTGLQGSRNLLACAPLTNPPPSRFVDLTTQSMGMHACPGTTPVAGIQITRNLLLCAGTQTGGEIEDFSRSATTCTVAHSAASSRVCKQPAICYYARPRRWIHPAKLSIAALSHMACTHVRKAT